MSEYLQSLMLAFAKVLRAEQEERWASAALKETTDRLKANVTKAETAIAEAWAQVKAIMDAEGVVEETLPGDRTDYRLYYTSPSRKVSVPDAKAVPEQFLKSEPKKKEIADHLRALEKSHAPLPNWAGWETGESSLAWKPAKRQS